MSLLSSFVLSVLISQIPVSVHCDNMTFNRTGDVSVSKVVDGWEGKFSAAGAHVRKSDIKSRVCP